MLSANTKYYVALVIDDREYVEQISEPMDASEALWFVKNAKRVPPPCRVTAIMADFVAHSSNIMSTDELKLELGIK